MKARNLLLCVLFLVPLAISAQVKVYEPVISEYPDLDPNLLAKFEADSKEFKQLVEQGVAYEALTERQKELFEDELKYEAGPFYSGDLGCSWYCAATPSGTNSTSHLNSSGNITYASSNIHDFDLRTAWIEGKPDGGVGEEIEISFELGNVLEVTHVIIFNGYCKSLDAWKNNARAKTLALYSNNEFLGHLSLADTYHKQEFDIGSHVGDNTGNLKLTFRIIEIYKGEKYLDTAISEINFDGTGDH